MTKSRLLEQIRLEHVDSIASIESKLQIGSTCSMRIRYRNQDIVGKLFSKFNYKLTGAINQNTIERGFETIFVTKLFMA